MPIQPKHLLQSFLQAYCRHVADSREADASASPELFEPQVVRRAFVNSKASAAEFGSGMQGNAIVRLFQEKAREAQQPLPQDLQALFALWRHSPQDEKEFNYFLTGLRMVFGVAPREELREEVLVEARNINPEGYGDKNQLYFVRHGRHLVARFVSHNLSIQPEPLQFSFHPESIRSFIDYSTPKHLDESQRIYYNIVFRKTLKPHERSTALFTLSVSALSSRRVDLCSLELEGTRTRFSLDPEQGGILHQSVPFLRRQIKDQAVVREDQLLLTLYHTLQQGNESIVRFLEAGTEADDEFTTEPLLEKIPFLPASVHLQLDAIGDMASLRESILREVAAAGANDPGGVAVEKS